MADRPEIATVMAFDARRMRQSRTHHDREPGGHERPRQEGSLDRRQLLFWPVRRFRDFVQHLFTVMLNEEDFWFGERTMNGHASEQVFTRIAEGLYVLC